MRKNLNLLIVVCLTILLMSLGWLKILTKDDNIEAKCKTYYNQGIYILEDMQDKELKKECLRAYKKKIEENNINILKNQGEQK